jgi:hypothetical protein
VGGVWARHAGANALAWGLAVAVVAWALTRWVLAPALSPILNAVLPPPALAGVSLTFGLGLGLWLGAARPPVAGHP